MPATPAVGSQIQIYDATGNAGTNNITVANNGSNIRGSAQTLIINVPYAGVSLVYVGAAYGWAVY